MGNRVLKSAAILVIYLIIVLPISYAVTITNETITPHQTSADFSWQTDNASTSRVDYGITSAYGQNVFSNNLVINHALQATGLTSNTSYYYRLNSSDGNLSAEKTGTFRTSDANPPPAPTMFNATSITKTSVTFSWDTSPASDFLKFTLYRNSVMVYNGTQASFTDANLTAGTLYNYQLSAWDISGNEGSRISRSITTLSIDTSAPIITNITLLESTDTNAKIGWNTDDNSTSVVYYRTSLGNRTDQTQGLTTNHSVQITVERGRSVFYKVSSCNEDEYCSNSTERGFIGGRDVTPPTINISLLDNSTNGIFWYNKDTIDLNGKTEGFALVKAFVNGDFQGEKTANENGTFNFSNVVLDTGLQTNNITIKSTDISQNTFSKTYKVMLDFNKPILTVSLPSAYGNRTLKINGNVSELSMIEVFLTSQAVTPSSVDVSSSSLGVQLSWNDTGASYYYIYRDDTLIGATALKTFLDKNITINSNYNYKVSSLNSACEESAKRDATILTNFTLNQTNSAVLNCTVRPDQSMLQVVGNFSVQLNFNQDASYLVKILATDRAGNTAEVKQNILVSTEKPIIETITPGGSEWFYTDALDSITVKGKTTPNSSVKLWVQKNPSDTSDKTTTADTSGNFEFKDVSFASASIGTLLSYTDSSPSNFPRWVNESRFNVDKNNLKTWLDKNRFFYLQATNPAGLKSDFYPSSFEMRTCYSGNFSWSLTFRPEYQSPQFLSVERLEQGTERMAFFFELKWIGGIATPDSVQIVGKPTIKKAALDTSQLSDKAYNLTKLMADGIDFSNMMCDPTFTKCYVVAKAPPIKTVTGNWSFNDWKQLSKALVDNQLKLPIQIEVRYKTINPSGSVGIGTVTSYAGEQTQVMCKELAYSLDNTKLDFSKLPDWLVNDGLKFINTSIKNLDLILKKAKPVIDAVGYVCVGSFMTYTAVRVARSVTEKMAMYKDRTVPLKSECYKQIRAYYDGKKEALPLNYISRLSNKNLQSCYPSSASLWNAEEKIYKAYQFSCNRIFCKTAPAKWTGETYLPQNKEDKAPVPIKDYNSVLMYLQTQDLNQPADCRGGETVRGMEMIKTTCDFKDDTRILNSKEFKESNGKDLCYLLDDAYWIQVDSMPDVTNPPPNALILKKAYSPVSASGGTYYKNYKFLLAMPLDGTPNGNKDRLFTGLPGSCEANCKTAGYDTTKKVNGVLAYFAERKTINECKQKIIDGSGTMLGATYGKDTSGDEFRDYLTEYSKSLSSGDSTKLPTCCCYSPLKTVLTTDLLVNPNDDNFKSDSNTQVKWDYRYSQTKYIYPDTDVFKKDSTSLASDQFDKTGIDNFEKTQRKYNPQLYFDGRDWNANFGLNHLLDVVSSEGKKTIPILNPKTQHVTAFQTLCLTGMYRRLQLLRNILNDIKTCIESAKYTGQYSSEVCKELFSRYVCQTVSDLIVTAGSGCSSFGWNNPADTQGSPLQYLSSGLSGVTEGVGGAITDFNDDYGNAKMSTMLGGGVGGFAQKACMAALGYEWELDFNSIMDAAYATEFASNVMVPTLRRTYLFTNPVSAKPVFEYRGGLYITPGCDIDGYTASLVCVSRSEKTKYPKDIKCLSTSDCACLNTATSVPPYSAVVTGGKITQAVPLDKAFHIVNDNSAYVYDHLRVELLFSNLVNKKNCLPEGHQDGIFYFPIADRTAFNLIGCEVTPSSGTLVCTSGLSKELGFSNAYINDVDIKSTATVGEELTMKPYITKTGDGLVCMNWRVYTQDPAKATVSPYYQSNYDLDSQFKTGSDIPPLSVFGAVVPNLIGSISQPTITYTGATTQGLTTTLTVIKAPLVSSTVEIKLNDKSGDGKFVCGDDQYQFPGQTEWKDWNGDCVINTGTAEIKLSSTTTTNPDLLKGKIITLGLQFSGNSLGSSVESEIFVVVEMKMPRTLVGATASGNSINSGSCTDAVSFGVGQQQTSITKRVLIQKAGTSTTTSSSSKFEPISIVDSTTSTSASIGVHDSKNTFEINPDKSYSVFISKPSDVSALKAVNWNIKDLNGNVKANGYVLTSNLIIEGFNKYNLYTISSSQSIFDKGKTYKVYVETHNNSDAVSSLSEKYIYFNPTSASTASLEQSCGPSGTNAKCQSSDCSDQNNRLNDYSLTGAQTPKCTSEKPYCCKT